MEVRVAGANPLQHVLKVSIHTVKGRRVHSLQEFGTSIIQICYLHPAKASVECHSSVGKVSRFI